MKKKKEKIQNLKIESSRFKRLKKFEIETLLCHTDQECISFLNGTDLRFMCVCVLRYMRALRMAYVKWNEEKDSKWNIIFICINRCVLSHLFTAYANARTLYNDVTYLSCWE